MSTNAVVEVITLYFMIFGLLLGDIKRVFKKVRKFENIDIKKVLYSF